MLRDPDALESGKEARSFLFPEKYLQSMLTYVSKHNSLAQAARVAEAAAAGITPKAQNPRRLHFPGEDGCIVFLDTHAMTAFKVTGE